MKVNKINFEDINFIKEAKKERVTFDNPKNANWFGIYNDDKLVSVYCLVISKNKARFKSNYTIPAFRKRGCLALFIQHSKIICKKNNIKEITAFCTPLSVNSHLRYGAKLVSKKNDICFVKYELNS